jgi:hypothetical protein
MAAPAATVPKADPRTECSHCKASVRVSGHRIGDSLPCPECKGLIVIVRSKTVGDLPPAVVTGVLTQEERAEVADALHRIKMRRVGRSSRHVELYPTWAILIGLFQFWLAGILAGRNLVALGQERRGRRMQVRAVVSYVVCTSGVVAFALNFWGDVPAPVHGALMAVFPLLFGVYYAWAQQAPAVAAREAGARSASVAAPMLVGVILGIAQAFAVYFIQSRMGNAWDMAG